MSDIQRRIVTLFEARGANQVRAMLGDMRSGFGQYRRELGDGERQLKRYGDQVSMVDKQVRALGTTLRYTVAGGAIFGGFAAVRNLSQIQEQLGLISAISPTAFGGNALQGEELTKFGEAAEDAAMRALTPITEFNDALINLVSSVQDIPQSDVVPVLEEIAKVAKTSQTPVEEATKGITGMLVAFGEAANLPNIQKFLAQYQTAIYNVPGGVAAGPQIIQQLPQLAAVSRLANINPEQMFGLLTTQLRAGGSPSTGARGLQYLIQGLAQPPSKEAAAALRGIGITPQNVQEGGGIPALLKLIEAVRTRGVKGNVSGLKGMSPEVLDQLEASGGAGDVSGLGISGEGAVLARKAVGRIHGVRSLILLAAQDEQMIEDLRMMADLGQNHAAQVSELRGTWQRFADRAQLKEAAIAIDQMAVDVAQIFEPVLNFAGSGVVHLRNLVDANPELAVGAGAAGLSALMLRRKMGVGGLLRGFGGAMAVKDAAASAANPESARGDSPTFPLWVAVAYSLSGPGAGGAFGRRGNSGPIATGGGGAAGGGGKGRRGIPGLVPGLAWGPAAVAAVVANISGEGGGLDQNDVNKLSGTPLLMNLLRKRGTNTTDFSTAELSALKMLDGMRPGTKGWDEGRASKVEALLRRAQGGSGTGINLKAKGEVTVNIDGLPGGRKRTTVPLELFSDFTQPAPTTRGKPKTYRGGN